MMSCDFIGIYCFSNPFFNVYKIIKIFKISKFTFNNIYIPSILEIQPIRKAPIVYWLIDTALIGNFSMIPSYFKIDIVANC